MREAMFTEKNKCLLCPYNCVIKEGKRGVCGVRINHGGKIHTLVYNLPCSLAVDPIEKKPLYHFYPGQKIFSFGTVGCNFKCKGCQNWEIARARPAEDEEPQYPPKKIVELAKAKDCQMIAYTYTEPTIFYEYMYETAKEAKKQGLKNVIVSNGYINEAPLRDLCKVIDAANIDIKFFDDKLYMKYAGGRLKPVLNTMKILKEEGVWLEVTNLMIPGWSDDLKMFEKMCKWLKDNLGDDVPLHISRFFPYHQLEDVPATPVETLKKAEKIAKKYLKYVYLGNVSDDSNTHCNKCKKLLIKRSGYSTDDMTKKGACECGEKLPGRF